MRSLRDVASLPQRLLRRLDTERCARRRDASDAAHIDWPGWWFTFASQPYPLNYRAQHNVVAFSESGFRRRGYVKCPSSFSSAIVLPSALRHGVAGNRTTYAANSGIGAVCCADVDAASDAALVVLACVAKRDGAKSELGRRPQGPMIVV